MTPAADEYWLKLVTVPRDWLSLPTAAIRAVIGFVVIVSGWAGEGLDREPRFHVVVGRHGEDGGTGVEMAWSRRRARRALAAVERDLETMSASEFRSRYDLSVNEGNRN